MSAPGNARFLWLLLCLAVSGAIHAQDNSWEDDFKTGPPPGQRAFTTNCAGCHGLDGHGSEKAPNITTNPTVQRLSDAQLQGIIRDGVAGTGMPAFHSLTPTQLRLLVSYIHTLQGKGAARTVPGDAKKGQDLFFGKGDCSTCHTILGRGGFLGPDLTGYGSSKSSAEILHTIVSKNRTAAPGFKSVVITTHDGTRIPGILRNEDNFSLQLQSEDGRFYFFERSALKDVTYSDQSRMPTDYAEKLSPSEISDLISFLMTTTSAPSTKHPSK